MTVQSKTYTVQLDAANNPEPLDLTGAAVNFTTTRWIVVNNLSPYIMELEGVGDNNTNEASVPPGTANKYAWTNKVGPLIANWVNPITGAPPSSPQVVVEYSDLPDGSDLAGTYPTTLSSGVTIGSLTGSVTLSGPVTIDTVEGSISIGSTETLFGPTNVGSGGGNITINPVSPGSQMRTLIISALHVGGGTPLITNVTVQGNQSEIFYYDQPPYLTNGLKNYLCVVPVVAALDTTYEVTLTCAAGAVYTVTITEDTAQYDESVFYNGVAQSASSATNGALLAEGPCRLLTATASCTGTTGVTLNGNSGSVLFAFQGNQALTFPPNTIIPAGVPLTCSGVTNSFQVSLTFAYP